MALWCPKEDRRRNESPWETMEASTQAWRPHSDSQTACLVAAKGDAQVRISRASLDRGRKSENEWERERERYWAFPWTRSNGMIHTTPRVSVAAFSLIFLLRLWFFTNRVLLSILYYRVRLFPSFRFFLTLATRDIWLRKKVLAHASLFLNFSGAVFR